MSMRALMAKVVAKSRFREWGREDWVIDVSWRWWAVGWLNRKEEG